ncbi:hypothetical protein GF342_00955 [Candidatus Woesearchaeota archaeon]|nr:hypothetical protein [Candidatus Woesearchaeota archaeon]
MSKELEEFIFEQDPNLYRELKERAKKDGMGFVDALRQKMSELRGEDDSFTPLYHQIKGQFGELITQEDVEELLNIEGVGRVYYDSDGNIQATGSMAQLIQTGDAGIPMISPEVSAYAPAYVDRIAAIAREGFRRLGLGVISVPSGNGIENYDGALDPTTNALLAVALKARSNVFGDKQFRRELSNRIMLGFTHQVQTARDVDDALQRIDRLRARFPLDRDGLVQECLDKITADARLWDKQAKTTSRGSKFPLFHQFLRGRRLAERDDLLIVDKTGSGKTGSEYWAYEELSKALRSTEGRDARMLVVTPAQPATSVFTDDEFNGKYTSWADTPKVHVVPLKKFGDTTLLDKSREQGGLRDGGIAVISDGKLSVTDGNGKKKLDEIAEESKEPVDPCDNRWARALRDAPPFDLVVTDEVQRFRKWSQRTQRLLEVLTGHGGAKRMAASATPLEHSVNDARTILYFLDREGHMGDPRGYDFNRSLEDVRELIRRSALVFKREDLAKVYPLPDLHFHDVNITMPEDIEQEYFLQWTQLYNHLGACLAKRDDDRGVSVKRGLSCLHGMYRTLFRGKMRGARQGSNRGIEQLIRERATNEDGSRRDQLIINARYVDHVGQICTLLDKLGISYIRLNGQDSPEKREEEIKHHFRTDKVQAIVSTQQALEVGIKITSNTGKPISMIMMDTPIHGGAYKQLVGRADRMGTVDNGKPIKPGPVNVYRVKSDAPTLVDAVKPFLETIEQEFNVRMPRDDEQLREALVPIDAAGFDAIDGQVRLFDAIFDPMSTANLDQLVDQSFLNIEDGDWQSSLDVDNGLLRLLIFDSPHRVATNFFKTHNGIDYKGLRKAQGKGAWRRVMQCYDHNWEFSQSNWTNTFLAGITRRLEELRGKDFEYRADGGCGAAYASRAFKQSFLCIDMDQQFLDMGHEICDTLVREGDAYRTLKDNKYLRTELQKTGLPTATSKRGIDLFVQAYVWQYQAQRRQNEGKTLRQIEDLLKETNRVMQVGGILLAPVQWGVDTDSFNKVLQNAGNPARYGFETLPISGAYTPTVCTKHLGGDVKTAKISRASRSGFKLIALRKVRDCNWEEGVYVGAPEEYALFTEEEIKVALGRQRSAGRSRGGRGSLSVKKTYGGYTPARGDLDALLVRCYKDNA